MSDPINPCRTGHWIWHTSINGDGTFHRTLWLSLTEHIDSNLNKFTLCPWFNQYFYGELEVSSFIALMPCFAWYQRDDTNVKLTNHDCTKGKVQITFYPIIAGISIEEKEDDMTPKGQSAKNCNKCNFNKIPIEFWWILPVLTSNAIKFIANCILHFIYVPDTIKRRNPHLPRLCWSCCYTAYKPIRLQILVNHIGA